ncbi:hypothetical protein [Alistipes sp.]|uniref:hypothetical protein n=1 Tax=Alistipes sp. TaxID=1872444 RepID=UPI003AF185B6
MRKLFTMICCAALLGGLAGCSDDKDEEDNPANGVNTSLLIGSWNKANGGGKRQLLTLKFLDDKQVTIDDEGSLKTVPYTFQNNTLKIYETLSYPYIFTVTSLTETNLNLHKKDIDDDYVMEYNRTE